VCVCVLCVCVCRSTDANKRASAHETNCPELLAWAKSKRCKHTVWREAALPSPGSETSKSSTDSLSDCSEASNESEALSAGTRPPPPDSNASEAGTFSPRPLRVLVHPEPELLPDSPIGEEVVGGVVVIQYKRVRVSYGGGGEEDALRSWVREVGESEFSSSEQEEGQEDGEGCNLSREERKGKAFMRQMEEMKHKGAESCCTGGYKRERLRRRCLTAQMMVPDVAIVRDIVPDVANKIY